MIKKSKQSSINQQLLSSENEIIFQKYKNKGAYHWEEYFGNLLKKNSFLKARYDLVVDLLKNTGYPISSSSRLLDIGCGDGALSALLNMAFGCKIYGVDPSEEGIIMAKEMFAKYKLMPTSFIKVTGYEYPYKQNYFDAVVCADVIEHVRQPATLLSEIKRVLKPGGQCIITTPIRLTEIPKDSMQAESHLKCPFFLG